MLQDDDFNKHDCDGSLITIDNICNSIQFSDRRIYNVKITNYLMYKIIIMYKNNNSDNKFFRDMDSENRALVLTTRSCCVGGALSFAMTTSRGATVATTTTHRSQ